MCILWTLHNTQSSAWYLSTKQKWTKMCTGSDGHMESGAHGSPCVFRESTLVYDQRDWRVRRPWNWLWCTRNSHRGPRRCCQGILTFWKLFMSSLIVYFTATYARLNSHRERDGVVNVPSRPCVYIYICVCVCVYIYIYTPMDNLWSAIYTQNSPISWFGHMDLTISFLSSASVRSCHVPI